jgi:hypothetical protein
VNALRKFWRPDGRRLDGARFEIVALVLLLHVHGDKYIYIYTEHESLFVSSWTSNDEVTEMRYNKLVSNG